MSALPNASATLPVVIKYGGHAMTVPALEDAFAADLVALEKEGWRFVVVHGGGPQISSLLGRLHIESRFEEGLRVTDEATMEAVEMVLAGQVNKAVTASLSRRGVRCAGVSGRDGGLLGAALRKASLGRVGDVVRVDVSLLDCLLAGGFTPVVAPVAEAVDGSGPLNINADTAAGAVAGQLAAEYFVLMSNVPGVLDGEGKLLPRLTRADVAALEASGVISGGMIPKVGACLHALDAGCRRALILNSSEPSALRRYLSGGEALGTVVEN